MEQCRSGLLLDLDGRSQQFTATYLFGLGRVVRLAGDAHQVGRLDVDIAKLNLTGGLRAIGTAEE